MFNISSYFERFKKLRNPEEDKIIIAEIIKQETGIVVETAQIKISNGKISLEASSILKNTVFLNKENILKKIQEQVPNLRIKNLS